MRELSSHMECPGEEHWKSIGRMVGNLKHEATHGLRFNKPKDLAIVSMVDSDFATNKDTRKSTTGYLVTVGGCLVSWMSKAQPSVTLSSTEVEYVAASMCVTELGSSLCSWTNSELYTRDLQRSTRITRGNIYFEK